MAEEVIKLKRHPDLAPLYPDETKKRNPDLAPLDMSEVVPKKKTSLLDNLMFELSILDNSSAQVYKAKTALNLNPVTLSISAGALKLKYLADSMFFVSGALELDKRIGRANLFGNTVITFAPETNSLDTFLSKTMTIGSTWEFAAIKTSVFRFGLDLKALAEDAKFTEMRQESLSFGSGASFIHPAFSAYATIRYMLSPGSASKKISDDLGIHYMQAQTGLIIADTVNLEYTHSPLSQKALIGINFDLPLQPNLTLSYKHSPQIFEGNVIMLGLSGEFDTGKKPSRISINREFAQAEVAKTRAYTAPLEVVEDVAVGKKAGEKGNKPDIEQAAKKVIDRIKQNENFDSFSDSFKNETNPEKLFAAGVLARLPVLWYNTPIAANLNGPVPLVRNIHKAMRDALMEENTAPDPNICSYVSFYASSILRRNDIECYNVGSVWKKGAQLFAIARDPKGDRTYLIGDKTWGTSGNRIWPLIEASIKEEGVVPIALYVFDKDNKIIGIYKTPEGRAAENMAGADDDLLKKALIKPVRKK